jgi:hypothetical protein
MRRLVKVSAFNSNVLFAEIIGENQNDVGASFDLIW